jgi:hypothetical protein
MEDIPGEMKNSYIPVKKLEGKRPLGKPSHT